MKIEIEIDGKMEQILNDDLLPRIVKGTPDIKDKKEALKGVLINMLKAYIRQNMEL